MASRIKEYYHLVKPGIVRGNALSLLGGYFLAASMYGFDLVALIGVVIGSLLIIASGCVFNNVLDRRIDAKMERTQKRALVQGVISTRAALIYGTVLGLIGVASLWILVNPLVTLLGLIGFIWYVFIYGLAKRMTPWSTLVGTVCGAIPPVAGYTAITYQIDGAAILLFVILMVWQMPHFYAIAIRRRDEYKAAGIPVLAVVKGSERTKKSIIAYIGLFCVTAPLLSVFGYTGVVYLALSIALGVWWLVIAIRTWGEKDTKKWAVRVFGISLVVLLAQSALFATGHLLP